MPKKYSFNSIDTCAVKPLIHFPEQNESKNIKQNETENQLK